MADNKQDEQYNIVKGVADNRELENYRRCFENNGTPRNLEHLFWLHQKNLANTHTIYYAMHGEEIAAIYTAMPVMFNVNGQLHKALQSIDTITDVNHRGKGLFPKLAAKLYEDAPVNNFELVYGFPNENSAPGFFKKLKWISFGEAPFMLKPLRIQYFLSKLLKKKTAIESTDERHDYTVPADAVSKHGNIVLAPVTSFGDDYDALWEKVSATIPMSVNRNAAYMNWRYTSKPGEKYDIVGLYEASVLKGIVVFTIKNKHNGRIGYTMELIYEPASLKSGVTLLKYASRIFKKEKTDAVLAWCFTHSFNYAAFRKAGYYNLPEKFRPQHLFLGVRAFSEKNKSLIEDVKNWYISYSDSDTV